MLSRDALRLLDQMRETIGVRAVGAKLQAPAAEHVATIQKALLDRRRLDMRYYSMSRDLSADGAVELARDIIDGDARRVLDHLEAERAGFREARRKV